jgi:hypothetical protein
MRATVPKENVGMVVGGAYFWMFVVPASVLQAIFKLQANVEALTK